MIFISYSKENYKRNKNMYKKINSSAARRKEK